MDERTLAEIAADDADLAARLKKFFADLEANVCPHCGRAIARKRQDGRCVYAVPCGCRLYQGRLTKAEREAQQPPAAPPTAPGMGEGRNQ